MPTPSAHPHDLQPSPVWDRVLFVEVLLLVLLLGCFRMDSGDVWWHLRTGQLIWERTEIPQTDWFTYTNPDAEWIDLHWLYQLFIAGLYGLGGVPALVLANAAIGTAIFALLLTVRRQQWPLWQSIAWLLPAILVFAGRYYVRPEMLSLLLLAAMLAVLFRARERPKLLWLLPLLQLAWVNVQGLFILGPIVWGCFLADGALQALLARRRRGESPEQASTPWKQHLAVTALMGLACLVNPYGWRGATFPLVLRRRIEGPDRAFYLQFAGEFEGIREFLSGRSLSVLLLNITTSMMLLLAVSAVLSVLLLARQRRFNLFGSLLLAVGLYLAFQASRNSVLLAVLGGYVLIWNMGELGAMASKKLAAAAAKGTTRRAASPVRMQQMVAVCLLVLIGMVPTNVLHAIRPSMVPRQFGVGEAEYWYAHDAARFVGRSGMPTRVFAAHQGQAAVVIFHNGPGQRVFADGRLEVNTPTTLETYLQVLKQLSSGNPEANETLQYGIEPGPGGDRELPALLFDLQTLVQLPGLLNNPAWRLVYIDDVAAVFLTSEKADELELPEVDVIVEGE